MNDNCGDDGGERNGASSQVLQERCFPVRTLVYRTIAPQTGSVSSLGSVACIGLVATVTNHADRSQRRGGVTSQLPGAVSSHSKRVPVNAAITATLVRVCELGRTVRNDPARAIARGSSSWSAR